MSAAAWELSYAAAFGQIDRDEADELFEKGDAAIAARLKQGLAPERTFDANKRPSRVEPPSDYEKWCQRMDMTYEEKCAERRARAAAYALKKKAEGEKKLAAWHHTEQRMVNPVEDSFTQTHSSNKTSEEYSQTERETAERGVQVDETVQKEKKKKKKRGTKGEVGKEHHFTGKNAHETIEVGKEKKETGSATVPVISMDAAVSSSPVIVSQSAPALHARPRGSASDVSLISLSDHEGNTNKKAVLTVSPPVVPPSPLTQNDVFMNEPSDSLAPTMAEEPSEMHSDEFFAEDSNYLESFSAPATEPFATPNDEVITLGSDEEMEVESAPPPQPPPPALAVGGQEDESNDDDDVFIVE